MKVIHFDTQTGSPDSEDWHAWRMKGIGGSDAAIIAAGYGLVAPYPWTKSLETFAKEKRGEIASNFVMNEAVLFGKEHEAEILDIVREELGIDDLAPVFGENENFPYIRASLDGYSFREKTIVEIKTTKTIQYEDPKKYAPQLIHQSIVANGDQEPRNIVLVVYYRAENIMKIYENLRAFVPPKLSVHALIDAEVDFWINYVEQKWRTA